MKHVFHNLLLIIAIIIANITILSSPAHAQVVDTATLDGCRWIDTSQMDPVLMADEIELLNSLRDQQFTARIVSCMRLFFLGTVISFHQNFWNSIKDVIALVVVLAVTIHGVRMVISELRNPWQETLGFFIKIAVVFMFIQNFGGLYTAPYKILDHLIYIVVQAVPNVFEGTAMADSGLFGTGLNCSNEAILQLTAGSENLFIWRKMDCILLGVISQTPGLAGVGFMMMLPALIIGLLLGGGLLFPIGMIIINYVWFMIASVLRAMVIYILALTNITILILISPIIFPLILFKFTDEIFEKWVEELLDAMIQPILVFTFLGFFLTFIADTMYILSGPIVELSESLQTPESLADIVVTRRNQIGAHTIQAGAIAGNQGGISTDSVFSSLRVAMLNAPDVIVELFVGFLTLTVLAYMMVNMYQHLQRFVAKLANVHGINLFDVVNQSKAVGFLGIGSAVQSKEERDMTRKIQQMAMQALKGK